MFKKVASIVTFIVLGLYILAVIGCASAPKLQTIPKYNPEFVPEFDFSSEQAESTNITIALLGPQQQAMMSGQAANIPGYKIKQEAGMMYLQPTTLNQYVPHFTSSLNKDIEGLLLARGFKISGPFADYQEMTFPQKKQSDLLLNITLGWSFAYPDSKEVDKGTAGDAFMASLVGGSGSKMVNVWQGPCSLTGMIVYEMWEPLSHQKLWFKKISIPPHQEDCSCEGMKNFVTVYDNAVAKLLEKTYKIALQKASDYFNREEIELIKKQSLELREKKMY